MSAPLLVKTSAALTTPSSGFRDARAVVPADQVVYKNLHRYRIQQLDLGIPTDMLSDTQWGLTMLDKCHHISTTTTTSAMTGHVSISPTASDICITCCQEANHIELGTYMDQESAILVNDVFELLNQRVEKLIVLRAEDASTLHLLTARKYDRTKGKDYCSILELLAERLQGSIEQASKKRKSPSSTTSSSGGGLGSPGSGTEGTTTRTLRTSGGRHTPALSETASFTSEETSSNPPRSAVEVKIEDPLPIDRSGGSSEKKQKRVSHSPITPEHIIPSSMEEDEEEDDDDEEDAPIVAHPGAVLAAKAGPPVAVARKPPTSPTRSPSFMRQRSYTFSTAADFSASNFHRNGMDTLAWFATLADDEVAVAKSLFELGSAKKADRNAANDEFLQSLNNHEGGVVGAASSASYLVSGFSYLSPKRVRDDSNNSDFIDPYQSNQFLTSYPSFYPSEQRKPGAASGLLPPQLGPGGATSGEDKLRLLSSAGLLMGDMSGILLNSPLREIRPGKYAFANHSDDDNDDDDDNMPIMAMAGNIHRRPRSQSMSVIEGSISSFANVTRGKDPLSIALRKYIERGGIPGEGYIGIYSPEDRKLRIERFLEKRKHRMWTKKVKYDVRKNFADSRIRIKGRFVKKDEEKAYLNQLPNSASKDKSEDPEDDEEEEDEDEDMDDDDEEQKPTKKVSAANTTTPSSSAKKNSSNKSIKKEILPPTIATPAPASGKASGGNSSKGKRSNTISSEPSAVITPQVTQSPASARSKGSVRSSSGKK